MRIRDEYLHGSDLTGVVKKIEVTIGTGNNANKSVIKYIKADSEGGIVEVPIGDITGKAATASKLDNTSAIGSKTNPVYFTANGVPSACTYSLNATVPVGAANQVLYYNATNTLGTQSYTTLTSNLDVFTVATSSAAGKKGLVPAPSANQLGTGNFFLRADGVWTAIENKTATLNGTATSLVTTGEKYNWNSAYNWYNSMTSGDTDGIINKWKEVEAFLANYGDSSTLAAELAKLVTLSTDQTITGVKTFSEVINGSITGNAGTADKLKNTVNINGVAFDGSADITITAVATGGNSDTVGGYSPSDFLLKAEHETFESIIATALTDLDNRKIEASDIPSSLPANGGNADTATKLQTARTIWGQSFDGTGNVSGNLTLGNDIIYGADSRNAFQPSGTDLYIGSGYTASGDRTFLYGNVIRMYTGTGSQSMYINSSGCVTIGASDKAGTDTKLCVDGNLAIGGITTSDKKDTSLSLYSINEAGIMLHSDGPGGDTAAIYEHKGGGNGLTFAEQNRDFIWRTGETAYKGSGEGVERMRLTNGGNVGIGISSPSYTLHVNGDIYTTTGFKKKDSSDSYVLLGGGGHKAISDFATAGHNHDGKYLTSHAYSYGSIDIYDINGAKKTSNNTVSASVNTETLRLQEGANIAITATNSGDPGSDNIKIAVTGITSNIDRNGYGQLALWNNGASAVSTTLQSVTFNELLTVKAGAGIDFSGLNGAANNDIWTISAIPYNCAITLNTNSTKSLIKDSWSADALSVYLTSNGTSSGTSLAAGTYALWIEDRSSSSGTPNYYSGTFTCAGSATAGRLDEIALHSSMATSADTNAPTRIFVATQISGTPGKHVLRFCSLDSSATNHYLTVKVNRII